jgi:hypothetical protein
MRFTHAHDVRWGTNGILPRPGAGSFKRLLDGALRTARPGASKQVRLHPNEFEMRHLLRQIELHVSVTSETIDPEREA